MSDPAIPGSATLTQRERELTARMHTVVTVAPDTVMAKPVRPGSLDRYLAAELSAGMWGKEPPFDFRCVGGTVARRQDIANLRTPAEFVRAFRLDYPGSPFRPEQPMLHVLEFVAVQPAQFVIPLGAPSLPYPRTGFPPNIAEVRAASLHMVEAAETVGLDPNSYRVELNPWPYSGTGITPDAELGVPEWWKRYGPLPAGAVVVEHGQQGASRPVATYRGAALGWRDLR
jgi:hypothetical protein